MNTTIATRTRQGTLTLLLSTVATLVAGPPLACGGIFTDISYDHGLVAYQDPSLGPYVSSTPNLIGTTLPVMQIRTATLAYAAGSATYAFTDDGTTAALTIGCQGFAARDQSQVSETSNFGDRFTFSQPVTYVANLTNTGAGVSAAELLTGTPGDFYIQNDRPTASGMLPAHTVCTLIEHWELSNATSSPLSGTESLSIVFTAVPEPASAAGLAIAAAGAAVLGRRRR